jgi:type I restriction enzyme R subunit
MPLPDDMEALSKIIETLNTQFGTDFSEDDRLSTQQLERRLTTSEALGASRRANPPERVRLTFEQVVRDALHEMVNIHFTFFVRTSRITPSSRRFCSTGSSIAICKACRPLQTTT